MTKQFEYCFHHAMECMGKECPALCRTILDNIADGVFTVDKKNKILWFNRASERITGFTKEEALGRVPVTSMPTFLPGGKVSASVIFH